jgi:hypothetical protein
MSEECLFTLATEEKVLRGLRGRIGIRGGDYILVMILDTRAKIATIGQG